MKQEKISNRTEIAKSTFDSNFNCCQSVLSTYAKDFNLDKDTSLMLASGFASGLSYQGKTCGAVVGAYMVIGLLAGYKNPDDELSKEITHGLIKEFNSSFVTLHKSVECSELLGKDVCKPEEYEYLIENNIFDLNCPKFVGDACSILDNIIKRYKNGKQRIF
ncbi:MAG TPA: C-GCAxxG-C-C family protein [Bacteroidales bacterium]|jgi:C_GCAxxG_C_C family probable redox protein|nr:C-GCAxxG-C-C family protein [Bacteroidales bacterium]|tara:strand:- start:1549 stop:2034 length:486 start_codon:yes stop_codon:yes gene_type:complete